MTGQRLALIVAVDRYDNPGLRRLAAPAADAEALADILGDPQLGGFKVDVLYNTTSSAAGEQIEAVLTERRPGDFVLLFFSCHGLKDDSGELFLAATNTSPHRLASTAVDAAWISRLILRSRAQQIVLFLDCCYGGAFERGVIPRVGGDIDIASRFTQGTLDGGRGRAIITASTSMEYAFEGNDFADGAIPGPSIFTGAVVEGIRSGAADQNQDGLITVSELYEYIYHRVRQRSPNQTPCKWEFGVQGNLYLARNPRRRVIPTQLPKHVLDLMAHPTAGGRLGAVDELAQLATGTHLGLAAAARLALTELAGNDSRRVSQAATDALARTALRLTPSTLDLGQQRLPIQPVVARVEVDGGPLACASMVTTSSPALGAQFEDAALRVSWTPTEPGRLDALVTLDGPAGTAQLCVTGEAVPAVAAGHRATRPALLATAGITLTANTARWVASRLPRRLAARLSTVALVVLVLAGLVIVVPNLAGGRPANCNSGCHTDENSGAWQASTPTVTPTVTRPSQAYVSSVTGSRPVDYWRLGDRSGSIPLNQVKNGGTAGYSTVTLGSQGVFGSGDDTAASLNGTSSYLSVPGSAIPPNGQTSTELWFNTTHNGTVLYGSQDGTIGSTPCPCAPSLWIDSNGKLSGLVAGNNSKGPFGSPGPGFTGKCIDDRRGDKANGTPVQVYSCNGGIQQSWTAYSDGTIRIFGKCMDIANSANTNGTKIQLVECHGSDAQKWQPDEGKLRNSMTQKCLDAPSTSNGAQFQLWDCTGGGGQQWQQALVSGGRVDDGKWHQAVLASDGTTQTLYLDGAKVRSSTDSAAYPSGTLSYTYVGAGAAGSWTSLLPANATTYFNGSIDELSFYTHGLSAADVLAHYQAAKSSFGKTPTFGKTPMRR
jgi:hypothetical protein